MPQVIRQKLIMTFFISVSLFGLFATFMFTIYPPTIQLFFPWRKQIVGSLFVSICLLGIIAAFSPKKCSERFHSRKKGSATTSEIRNVNSQVSLIVFEGHHPNCTGYSAHVISLNGHVFCAACTGLILGAFAAIAGAALYFFIGLGFGTDASLTLLVGQVGVALGFFQFKFGGFTRLTLNAFFVFASMLILVGIDSLRGNVFVDLYVVVLIVFWLFTRIVISQWDHWRICHSCKLSCELK